MESGDVKAVKSVKVGQSKGASRANEVRKAKTKGVSPSQYHYTTF